VVFDRDACRLVESNHLVLVSRTSIPAPRVERDRAVLLRPFGGRGIGSRCTGVRDRRQFLSLCACHGSTIVVSLGAAAPGGGHVDRGLSVFASTLVSGLRRHPHRSVGSAPNTLQGSPIADSERACRDSDWVVRRGPIASGLPRRRIDVVATSGLTHGNHLGREPSPITCSEFLPCNRWLGGLFAYHKSLDAGGPLHIQHHFRTSQERAAGASCMRQMSPATPCLTGQNRRERVKLVMKEGPDRPQRHHPLKRGRRALRVLPCLL
jgi:hypothetical protein